MKRFMLFAAAAGVYLLCAPVNAATLGITPSAPLLTADNVTVDYLEFAGDGDLSAFDAAVTSADGTTPAGDARFSFGIGFSLDDPAGSATGGFDIVDDSGLFLDGTLSRLGYRENTIELLFTDISGSAASNFGFSVLAVLTSEDWLGPNPFSGLVDGSSYQAAATISAIPIPAPAALLITSLGLLWLQAVRRTA